MAEEKKAMTLRDKLDAITFKNEQAQKVADLVKEKEKVKSMIENAQKSKRGPSLANRISGLETLKNTLGKQFYKKSTD